MRECDNSKIHIRNNSLCLYISLHKLEVYLRTHYYYYYYYYY